MKNYNEVYEMAKSLLSKERFYHSECVANRCVELASIYGVDVEAARLVGISHDIAKELSNEKKLKYCKDNYLEVDEVEELIPSLLHGKIGAHIAKTKLGFSEDLCSAIQYHTTGKRNMSMLDKILYVADMTSEDRKFEDKDKIIKLGNENLDECVKYILKVGIGQRLEADKIIHLNSIKALNYLNEG